MLLAQQVERHPHATAFIYEGYHLTYEDLDRRATQLAIRLQHLGVGPEIGVGSMLSGRLQWPSD